MGINKFFMSQEEIDLFNKTKAEESKKVMVQRLEERKQKIIEKAKEDARTPFLKRIAKNLRKFQLKGGL